MTDFIHWYFILFTMHAHDERHLGVHSECRRHFHRPEWDMSKVMSKNRCWESKNMNIIIVVITAIRNRQTLNNETVFMTKLLLLLFQWHDAHSQDGNGTALP
jgi:hypothetical protein